MRRICSWGRRAAHSHPVMSIVVAAACASGIALQGCSQNNSGRSLLSRLTRSQPSESESSASHAGIDDTAVAGGLRQGTRREAGVASVTPADTERRETSSARETTPSTPTSRDPWVRQQAPTIPDDGRPVAGVNRPATTTAARSRGVDEWLNQIDSQRQSSQAEPTGLARLTDIEPETTTSAINPFSDQTSLASSRQTGDRPVWASESTPQSTQSERTAPAQAARTTPTTRTPVVSSSASAPTDSASVSRRTDALLQIDALLTRAHDLETQGKPHEAYRFALVAHQIVQQERLTLPPGQERPIDYLDALSAASDTVEHDSAWTHQQNVPSQPASSSVAGVHRGTQSHEQDEWVASFASRSTERNSPFQETSGFAEWRTLPPSQSVTTGPANSPQIRSATFDGNAVPTIRPSSFGQRQESEAAIQQSAVPKANGPEAYGPRFSDPVTSTNVGLRTDTSVQPVSLSGELTDPIDTASLSQPQNQSGQFVEPPAWRGPSTTNDNTAVPAIETGLLAPQLGPSQQTALNQPISSFQGPAFGTQVAVTGPAAVETTSASDDSDDLGALAIEADADTEQRVAGKSLTFWAMIGGLVLLLACALLRRSTEPRESFH